MSEAALGKARELFRDPAPYSILHERLTCPSVQRLRSMVALHGHVRVPLTLKAQVDYWLAKADTRLESFSRCLNTSAIPEGIPCRGIIINVLNLCVP